MTLSHRRTLVSQVVAISLSFSGARTVKLAAQSNSLMGGHFFLQELNHHAGALRDIDIDSVPSVCHVYLPHHLPQLHASRIHQSHLPSNPIRQSHFWTWRLSKHDSPHDVQRHALLSELDGAAAEDGDTKYCDLGSEGNSAPTMVKSGSKALVSGCMNSIRWTGAELVMASKRVWETRRQVRASRMDSCRRILSARRGTAKTRFAADILGFFVCKAGNSRIADLMEQ